ncbi:MAG TPA: DUF2281 domain-containing protein [Anaerolineae bacterium]
MMAQTTLKYDVKVNENGRVELDVPFPAGARVTVFIIESGDVFDDLLAASESSLDFWNHPLDDEDWISA